MVSRRSFLVSCSGALSALYAPSGAGLVFAAQPKLPLFIVTKQSSPLRELSLRELKRLYLGEYVASPDGGKLIPLNHAEGSPERLGFERAILGMSPDQLVRFWIDRRIRGQSGPPKTVSSPELLRRAVAAVDYTVTYLRAVEADSELKVVLIDGKQPGDDGYAAEE
jgi:hypothetical protein